MYKFNKDSLIYERVNIWKYVGMIAFSLLIVFTLSSFVLKEVVIVNAEKEVILKTNEDFSKDKLLLEVEKYSFKYPDIVMAQAILESGHFKSPVFKQNHNMFGMRQALRRISTAQGSNLNHAYYTSWKDCVADRALYEAHYLSKLTREQYFSYLDQVYAEGGGYSKLLKQVIQKMSHDK
jgi:Ca2+/Na+ antiporter